MYKFEVVRTIRETKAQNNTKIFSVMILLQRKLSYGGKATLNFNKNQI